jgi:hypothetical protein
MAAQTVLVSDQEITEYNNHQFAIYSLFGDEPLFIEGPMQFPPVVVKKSIDDIPF